MGWRVAMGDVSVLSILLSNLAPVFRVLAWASVVSFAVCIAIWVMLSLSAFARGRRY